MTIKRHTAKAATLSLMFLVAGCTGLDVLKPQPDNTVFYILGINGEDPGASAATSTHPAILVGSATLPKFLNQSHIVSLKGTHELVYADRHRWGEPLEEGINRILVDRLSLELGSSEVTTMRVRPQMKWDYRVGYAVQQLGGKPGKYVRLDVDWWVRSTDDSVAHFKTSLTDASIKGSQADYAAYVSAIEKLLESWAMEVAATIGSMHTD
jgi:uncharacterized lipoprotein YmbA